MKDQLAASEMKFALEPEKDFDKLKNFYRIWVGN
jgi:hypothetical protein